MVHCDKENEKTNVQKIAVILDNGLTFSALDPLNNLKSLKYMFIKQLLEYRHRFLFVAWLDQLCAFC